MEELNRQQTMPALALRGLTVFPQMLLHFDVGRQASIQARVHGLRPADFPGGPAGAGR